MGGTKEGIVGGRDSEVEGGRGEGREGQQRTCVGPSYETITPSTPLTHLTPLTPFSY